jgi:hypothetical protein
MHDRVDSKLMAHAWLGEARHHQAGVDSTERVDARCHHAELVRPVIRFVIQLRVTRGD